MTACRVRRDWLGPAISRPSRRTRKLGLGMPAKVSFPAMILRAASARPATTGQSPRAPMRGLGEQLNDRFPASSLELSSAGPGHTDSSVE